jgi:hypothetical protein
MIRFWLPLSFHADSHEHILVGDKVYQTCKEIIEGLTELLSTCKNQQWLEDTALLFANLAFTKMHKLRFDESKELLSIFLKLMSDENQSLKVRAVASQFFYNLLHKCTRTITVLNKKAVLEEIRLMIDEGERAIDRLTFDESVGVHAEQKNSQVHLLKTFVENLRILTSMISINCPPS